MFDIIDRERKGGDQCLSCASSKESKEYRIRLTENGGYAFCLCDSCAKAFAAEVALTIKPDWL
ncbi:MAG: hypothetical protein FWF85_02545 [Clostridiales bacterium]|nr:hypothetical protein [Clostridiales bacterium]